MMISGNITHLVLRNSITIYGNITSISEMQLLSRNPANVPRTYIFMLVVHYPPYSLFLRVVLQYT